MDNWKHRSDGMRCKTCMYFVPKKKKETHIPAPGEMVPAGTPYSVSNPIYDIGRCRKDGQLYL